ncbi:32396_t:CDS:1 [Racocetra persica]|uniref:32396_t:CDS:1 n=1 Tax=Racocetra persica TaxID=160502 RepID=A0ACA9NI67_9GLOM|nr:32396_t:CDS:1 [Racocetra persica]
MLYYYGFNSEKYYEQLEKMDKQIGEILSILDRKGWLEGCLLILTTDHGGVDTTHGKDSDLERNVFIIIRTRYQKEFYVW